MENHGFQRGKQANLVVTTGQVILFWCRVAVVVGAAALATAAVAQQPAISADYDIPAQPLDTALDAYIRSSGAQVLYETVLTKGRQSNALEGSFTPEAALEILLSGTGLTARRADVDAFIVTELPDQNGPTATAIRPDGGFAAALQLGVLKALCRTPATRPGSYRAAIELWIAPSGAIQRSALIGSTGDASRDKALLSTLRGASVRMAPPADLPQPFILTIGARANLQSSECPN